MEQDVKIQQLLEEIKKETGITFDVISEHQEGYEETLSQLRKLLRTYKASYSREYFLHRLLQEDVPSAQMYQTAGKFHLDPNNRFQVYAVEICQKYEVDVNAILKSLFHPQTGTFVIPMSDFCFVLVKAVRNKNAEEHVGETANMIRDMLNTEAMLSVRVTCGSVADGMKNLRNSYREARMAMKIGSIFHPEESVFHYGDMGIERLIYELPLSACKAYVKEVFGEKMPEVLDKETITTIHIFFENGLSISETARKLYVHRNTLVYRLEKLQKVLGLDIRNFEDAMTYKIVAMIAEYIQYIEQEEKDVL